MANASIEDLRADAQLSAAERITQAMELSGFLIDVAGLSDAEVAFVVIGGYALAAHGVVRATKDVEIVPDPHPENLSRLARTLNALDATADLIAADELGLQPDGDGLRAGGNWILRTRYGRLDIMQDVPGLRDYPRLTAGSVTVNGISYAGYDELISMRAPAAAPRTSPTSPPSKPSASSPGHPQGKATHLGRSHGRRLSPLGGTRTSTSSRRRAR